MPHLYPRLSLAFILNLLLMASAQAAWGLPELMQALAKQTSARATFVERKYMAVLDKPMESKGELTFTAPSRLEKHTNAPIFESLILDGNALTLERNGRRTHSVNLTAHPEAAAFVESIRGTLAGDLTTLKKHYALDLTGTAERWKLSLTPLDARMQKVVSRIRVEGTQSAIRLIAYEQADGDRSEMLITQLVPANAP